MELFSKIKKKVVSREAVLGNWSILAYGSVAEIAATAGLDFQILDMEHGVFDLGTLEQAIRACESRGGAPLVRVPKLCISTFQSVLDLGAHGIIVPQIKSADEAEMAVRFAKYAPEGTRGYNPFTRAGNYAGQSDMKGGKLNNDFGLLGVIIENQQAFNNLTDILEVSGIDIIYLGVYDMSISLGCGGNTKASKVIEFVKNASEQIIKAGKTVGMMINDEKEIAEAFELGVTFLVYSVDANILYKAMRSRVEAFRKLKEKRNENACI